VGTVFKKTVTRPLPPEAEIVVRKGESLARWKDRRGKTRTAPLTVGKDGSERIVTESPYYVAKWRDGAGVVRVEATGCRDEQAARQVLADLERRAELIRAGVMTTAEAATGEHSGRAIAGHFDAYLTHFESAGASAKHRYEVRRLLYRLAGDCCFGRLADLDAGAVERWLVQRAGEDMSASTRNSYLAAAVAFVNWCIADGRLAVNPFARIAKANEDADRRRTRRALDDAELIHLLDAARRRPLLDALTIRRGKRKGQAVAHVGDAARSRLELLGRERALVYKTFLLTGLRRGELASLTVGQLHLEGPVAFLSLDAGDEKNREGSDLALRDDIAADLRDWLADKLRRLQEDARKAGDPIPARLPADTPLFNVPLALVKILNRDLRLAGIAKRDDRGRTIDVHALRHTFATHLSRGGVAPRTAQAAMRHSTIDLTMNTYTDPRLLDVRGALDALPLLPLGRGQAEGEALPATGTDGGAARTVAPTVAPVVAPTADNRGQPLSSSGNPSIADVLNMLAVTGCPVNGKGSLSSPDSEPSNCGEWTRTTDLQVMSLASYHCSTPRPVRAALVSESPA
jgi:integrase